MAYVRRIPGRKVWIAGWRDTDGKLRSKTTGERDRKKALRIAEEYEAVAKGNRTFATIREALGDLCKEYTGQELPQHTTREYFDQFIKMKKGTVGASTLRKYEEAINSLMTYLGDLADKPVSVIQLATLESWRSAELERIRPSTLNLYTRLVKQVFKRAQAEGLRTDNPATLLEKLKEEEKVREPFSLKQIRQIMAVASDEWQSMCMFGLYTGQRLGDLASLKWSAIDTEKGIIRFKTQKTGKDLPFPIAAPLMRHIATLPSAKSDNAPIHPDLSSKTQQRLSALFSDLLIEAGIREKCKEKGPGTKAAKRTRNPHSFHSFRHTAVSMLKNAGVAGETVQNLIGHDSAEVSKGYTHLEIDTKRRALEVLPDLG